MSRWKHGVKPHGIEDLCVCAKTGRTVCEPDPTNRGGFRLLKDCDPFPAWCPGFEPWALPEYGPVKGRTETMGRKKMEDAAEPPKEGDESDSLTALNPCIAHTNVLTVISCHFILPIMLPITWLIYMIFGKYDENILALKY